MRKIQYVLFLAFVVSFVACKGDQTAAGTTDAATTPSTDVTSTTVTPVTDPNSPPAAVPTGPTTTVQFDNDTYDYGTVTEGEMVNYSFKFKNTGNEPLIISDAKGSCGCTVPDWPREPIAPGKTGEIKVAFDSKGKGSDDGSVQSKRVTITANTDPVQTYLTVKGIVKKAK